MEKNVFKDIEPTAKLPKSAKQDVLKKIEAAKLLLDFWDLMTVKRVGVNLSALEQRDKNKITQSKNKKK
ncbi:MAG: hypothetical protein KJP21_06710 [Bacteroidia bacterium]|nr:hypothetical protein [Bacteroidia bacterium]NNJ56763.1 hypothetical protein [Bacteroidia bacterium]